MSACRYQVSIPMAGGTPADISMNTWYFRTTDNTPGTLAGPIAALAQFYTAIKANYPSSMNFAAANVKVYNMASPKPRPPIYEVLLGTTGTGTGVSGPPEVAMCISFHGTKVAGQNFARVRGRVFIGPLTSTLTTTPQPSSTLITALVTAATNLLTLSQNNTYKWVVWSQAQSDDPQQNAFPDANVTGGWVDNAWDTQRRRGIAPSSRTLYGSPNLVTILPAEETASSTGG